MYNFPETNHEENNTKILARLPDMYCNSHRHRFTDSIFN